jgi:thiol-disulfide isomerase/thioredoxin
MARMGGLAVLLLVGLAGCAVGGGPQPAERGDVQTGGPRRAQPLAVGHPVPGFAAPGLDGQVVRWRDRRAGPTVLVVWAAWCPHCRRLLPILGQVGRDFPSVGVVTVTTSIGRYSGPSPEEVARSSGLSGPTAVDAEDNPLARALGVYRYPMLYWVGPDGRVRDVTEGAADEASLRQAFRRLAAGPG